MLRATHEPVLAHSHPHTGVSMSLRQNMIEGQILHNMALTYMQAWAALSSHKDCDIEKAGAKLSNIYFDANRHIVYLTGGKDSQEAADDERLKAVERYNKIMRKPVSGAQ